MGRPHRSIPEIEADLRRRMLRLLLLIEDPDADPGDLRQHAMRVDSAARAYRDRLSSTTLAERRGP